MNEYKQYVKNKNGGADKRLLSSSVILLRMSEHIGSDV
jgi:hypothetical protein